MGAVEQMAGYRPVVLKHSHHARAEVSGWSAKRQSIADTVVIPLFLDAGGLCLFPCQMLREARVDKAFTEGHERHGCILRVLESEGHCFVGNYDSTTLLGTHRSDVIRGC